MADPIKTIDHHFIKRWADEQQAVPARKADTPEGEAPIRFYFSDFKDDKHELEEVGWEEFFRIFEKEELAMIYDGDGDSPKFNRFIHREEEVYKEDGPTT